MKKKIEIKIKNLNLTYTGQEDVVALKNINLNLPGNRLTTLIGPSGCGKTTLLKTLNRLHEIKENVQLQGKIIIGGQDIIHSKQPIWELRQRVGLISQKPYPLPASIYDNVSYGPRLHGQKNGQQLDQIVEHCLSKAHLWSEVKDRLSTPATALSVGQLQRLSIARSLAIEPEVLLCDEITSALDPISSARVEELLLNLKEDYTIILVTHILRQAKRLADNVVFLYLGQVIETGPADEFFNNPTQEKTKKYLQGIMAG